MTLLTSPVPSPSDAQQSQSKGAERTRQAILRAGRELFARHGYAHTNLREVARLAEANVALIGRYFGSKEGLFRAVVDEALSLEAMLDIPLDRFGAEVARRFYIAEDTSSPLAMTALSVADPVAHDIASDIVHERVAIPLAAYLGEPDGLGRASRLIMLWSGFTLGLRLMPRITAGTPQAIEKWLGEATQAIIDEGKSASA